MITDSLNGTGFTCNKTNTTGAPPTYPPSSRNTSYSIHLQTSPQKNRSGTVYFMKSNHNRNTNCIFRVISKKLFLKKSPALLKPKHFSNSKHSGFPIRLLTGKLHLHFYLFFFNYGCINASLKGHWSRCSTRIVIVLWCHFSLAILSCEMIPFANNLINYVCHTVRFYTMPYA
mgnify:CR=1 FL=1